MLKYANAVSFKNAVFPDNYELDLTLPYFDGTQGVHMFMYTKGLKKITLHTPNKDKKYSGTNFANENTLLEEIDLSDFSCILSACVNFALKCTNLRTIIGELDVSGVNNFLNFAVGCGSLENITFKVGTIKYSISFANSPLLSDTSIQSITDGLADLTGSDTQTLTVHTDVEARMTDEQKATITSKNWTLAVA